MTHHYVCYINVAIDSNKKCKKHLCCCRLALKVGVLVYCDARYISLVKGRICYMDVRVVTFDGKLSCHVGVVKVLLGGAMPNRPKNENCPITMKFGDIVGFAFIKK